MEINNTNFQLQTVILSFCTKHTETKEFKYFNTPVDPATCAEFIYPIICHLSESEFSFYFNRKNLEDAKPLFSYKENLASSMFKPISVRGTIYLSEISFSMIAPFFIFWLKNLIDNYYNKLELLYIHFPKELIFKN